MVLFSIQNSRTPTDRVVTTKPGIGKVRYFLFILKSTAESATHDSCSAFNTTQLQSERASFQDVVRKTIGRRFGIVGADVQDLQVQNIMRTLSNSVAGLLSYLGVRLIAENSNTVNVELEAPAIIKYTYT
ncbi:uncharacterized protein LOC111320789 [Stylophora pistillata]|uniref:uncharacterized protein LOC111320789 n=1 Tax=Stylophora pistillata TaxID=50429 RepID=UPI000C04FAB3|nr:uncharacterized protein LOC111320789 [Stylophora pistillata]